MADGKREHDFNVAIGLTCYIGSLLTGQFDPLSANPYGDLIRSSVIEYTDPEQRKEAAKTGVAVLGTALTRMFAKQSRRKRRK